MPSEAARRVGRISEEVMVGGPQNGGQLIQRFSWAVLTSGRTETVGCKRKPRRSVDHTQLRIPRSRIQSSNGTVCTRHIMKGRASTSFRVWTFLTVSAPHLFLLTTTNFDHGPEVPTVETPGCYSLHVERGYRGHESRKGGLEHDTS